MKKIILLVFLSTSAFSQKKAENKIMTYAGYATEKKDTLFFQDDQLGRTLKDSWLLDKNYNGTKPIIILVPDLQKVVRQRKKKLKIKYTS